VKKIAGRNGIAWKTARGIVLPDHYDAIGLAIGETSEERRIDDAENRGVRTDTEGESEHDDDRETRDSGEHSYAVL
jgi:hypothetical protein